MEKVQIAIGLVSQQPQELKPKRHWFEQEMIQMPCECHQLEGVEG